MIPPPFVPFSRRPVRLPMLHDSRVWSAVIVLVTLAAFGRTIGYDFTNLDDPQTISLNPKLNPPTPASLAEFWDPARPQMDLYVPVTYTLWSVLARLAYLPQADPFGVHLNSWVFHGANVLLHALSALVAFRILRLLVRRVPAAAAGALLFALHPVQVEPVAWASGTKDVLAGLLSLAALWGYLAAARPFAPTLQGVDDEVTLRGASPARPSPGTAFNRWYWVGTASLVLAMLSKPSAIVTPLIAAALDLLLLGRRPRDVARSVLPWLALAVPVVIEGRFAQPAAYHQASIVPLYLRPLIATDALAFYLYKLVWPASLGFLYNRSPAAVLSHGWLYWTWILPATVALAVLAPLVVRQPCFDGAGEPGRAAPSGPKARLTTRNTPDRPLARRRFRRTWPAAALAVFWLAVLPVLGLVPFDWQQFSTVADHYLYLAMLGPALALAYALGAAFRSGPVLIRWTWVACLLVLTALGIRTFLQAGYWQDSFTLYPHCMAVNPYAPELYDNLSKAYADTRQPEEALRWDEQAVRRWPGRAASHANLASDLAAVGRLAEAEAQYRTALEIEPSFEAAKIGLQALRRERR